MAVSRFFDLSPDAMCIAGFDGYFKKVNRSFIHMLGYTAEELYTRPVNAFSLQDIRKVQDTDSVEILNLLKLASERLSATLDIFVNSLGSSAKKQDECSEIELQSSCDQVMTFEFL